MNSVAGFSETLKIMRITMRSVTMRCTPKRSSANLFIDLQSKASQRQPQRSTPYQCIENQSVACHGRRIALRGVPRQGHDQRSRAKPFIANSIIAYPSRVLPSTSKRSRPCRCKPTLARPTPAKAQSERGERPHDINHTITARPAVAINGNANQCTAKPDVPLFCQPL